MTLAMEPERGFDFEPLDEAPPETLEAPSGKHFAKRDLTGNPLEAVCDYLEEVFAVSTHGSTVGTEIRAGVVTWVTMSYIVVVNPMILSAVSADSPSPVSFHTACVGTCLSAAVATAFVGIVANLPFGLAAGMGLNSYFRYGIVGKLGLPADAAFACSFSQAVLFALFAASGLADRLQEILPCSLKCSITVAIGIFQAFVGFQLMGLVVKNDVTLVTLGDIKEPTLLLSLTATLLVAALLVRRTKGALLLGIGFAAVAAHVLGLPNSRAPAAAGPLDISTALVPSVVGVDFNAFVTMPQPASIALICMLFIVLFDTAGVQHGLGQQAGLLDAKGRLPRARDAYLASALGTGLGALLGTSPVIIHNETAAGIQEGGRTGLTAVTTAFLFLLSPLLVPLIELIPPEATAPCLVIVGVMMMGPVREIDFSDLRIALPAFLTICVTPLTYSISAGILSGMLSYFILGAVLRLSEVAEMVGKGELRAGPEPLAGDVGTLLTSLEQASLAEGRSVLTEYNE